MPAVLLPNGKQQFFTTPGVPAVGYKLATFAAGTSTPQTTWSDALKVGANTNPIILDARGEAVIFWDGTYKVQLQDATGVVIWTVDNVTSSVTPSSSLIPTVDNSLTLGSPAFSWTNVYVGANHAPVLDTVSGNIGYYARTASEIAVSVTPANFSVPPYWVTRYANNTNPGFTDMTAAIQTAVSVAQASVNTRFVYFPPGTYLTTGINLTGSLQSIKFRGDGATITSITNAPLMGANASDDLEWEGLYFTGNAAGVSNNQFGVELINTSRSRVINCHFENLSCGVYDNNALTGLFTSAVQIPSQVSGNTIKNCFNGILTQDDGISNFGEYLRIENNTINDCQNWGILNHAGNTAIVANSITGNGGGVLIDSAGSINGDHGLIEGNMINHNFRANLYIKTTLRSMIVNGNNLWACLSGNLGAGALASSFGAYIDTSSSIVFTNNVLGRNKTNLGTNAVQFCQFFGNQFLTDPATTVDQWVESTVYGSPNFNFYGANSFTGTFTSGGLVGNPNGDFAVGVTTGAPAFVNAWVNLGGAFATVKYWKDSSNVVHLSGNITAGTIGNPAFTLPPTMRPADGTRVFTCFSNGAIAFLQITTSGTVIPAVGSNVSFSLDGVSFRAGAVAP